MGELSTRIAGRNLVDMIQMNGTDYGLCLLDTNAVSVMVKGRDREFRHFIEWSLAMRPVFIPCFSLFTVLELRQSPAAYQGFTEVFREVPCILMKSYDQLVNEEARDYPDPTKVDPCLVGFAGPLATQGAGLDNVLEAFFQTADGLERERTWNEGRAGIVEGIRSLVANYPPKGRVYTPSEVRTFLEIIGFSQIAMHERDFAQKFVDGGQAVEIDSFPSVKAATFTVFHKFYMDVTRKPSDPTPSTSSSRP